MLTIKKISGATEALHYYTNQDNYYLSDRETLNRFSKWLGRGAETLQLSGEVNPDVFLKLLNGELPSGQLLGVTANGQRQHRPGTDITLSAPKSVSLLALVGKDERLLKAHEEAVAITLERIERLAAEARVTFNKETAFEKTRNLVVASFLHNTSRALEPNLHTHCAIMNMTERADGLWRALSSRAKNDKDHLDHGFRELLYANQHYLGLVYNSSLAKGVTALGFSIRIVDQYGNFEIEGIPDELIKATSSRREEIENDMKERGTFSAKAAEKSNLSTRKAKREVDNETLERLWAEKIASYSIDLNQLIDASKKREGQGEIITLPSKPISLDAKQAVSDALEHLAHYSSQIRHGDLVRQAMCFSANAVGHEDIEQEIDHLLTTKSLQGKPFEYYTSAKLLQKEANFIVSLKQDLNKSYSFEVKGQGLVSSVLKNSERVQIIDVEGFKTECALIQDLVNSAQANRLNTYVLHPGYLKTQQLREQIRHPGMGFMAAIKNFFKDDLVHTVSGFLYHYGKSIRVPLLNKHKQDLILVHDAQKLSYDDIAALSDITKESQSKLILLNNASSTLGFSAGNPLKRLKEEGVKAHQSLNAAVSGELTLAVGTQSLETMIGEWLKLSEERQFEHALVAINNQQQKEINEKVRAGLVQQGQLSRQTKTVSVLTAVHLTPIQKERVDVYQVGDVLTFYSKSRVLRHYVVQESNNEGLILKNQFGKTSQFLLNGKEAYRVSRPKSLDIAVGERLKNELSFTHQKQKFAPESAFIVSKLTEKGVYLRWGKQTLYLDNQTFSAHYFSYDYCKKPQALSPKTPYVSIAAKPYQLTRNLIREIGEHAETITLFTHDEVKTHQFLEKEQIKWTAYDIQQRKPELIYRDIAFASQAIETDLNALIANLSLEKQDKQTIAQTAVHYALSKCAERQAAFKHSDLMTHALMYALGKADFDDIAPVLKERMAASLVHLETYWTTKEALNLEQSILKANRSEQGMLLPIESNQQRLLALPDPLTQGQKDAIHLVTTTRDRFVTIQGLAGVGKTTMMRQVQAIATENQFKVLGLAPTHKAVRELQANGISASTIDSFLYNDSPIDASTLLIVDESSMIDNEKYHALQQKCIQFNARMVFTGDITQLQSLSSGIPHELTIKSQTQKTAYMNEIVRQNPNPALKKAALFASKRQIGQALETLKTINPEDFVERVTKIDALNTSSVIEIECSKEGEKDYQPIYQAIADDFLSRTLDCQKNTLVVAHAHEDRGPIVALIRQGLKQQNQIAKEDCLCGRLVAKSIDKADQVFAKTFAPGDVIRFGKNYSVAKRDDYFTVNAVDRKANKLICRDETNRTFSMSAAILPKTYPSFYSAKQSALAIGDRIRLKRNDIEKGMIANAEYRVISLANQQVVVSNGKEDLTLDLSQKSFQHWDYAYTNTAYSSQGATSQLIIALELQDRIVVTTHRSHEIDLTRASHQATIYTDHLEGLISRLENPLKQRDADKTSAVLTQDGYLKRQKKQQTISTALINKAKSQVGFDAEPPSDRVGGLIKTNQANTSLRPNADLVYTALMQVIEPVVKGLLGEPNKHLSTPNDYRYGRKGSLSINKESGLWYNFETKESGNLFHLIAREQGLSEFKDVLDYAKQCIHYLPEQERQVVKPKKQALNNAAKEGKRDFAKALFKKSLPIKGSLAEKYLVVQRGLHHYDSANLRYCPSVYSTTLEGGKKSVPALLAFSLDEKGEIHHVQVIKLDQQTGNKDLTCNSVKQTFGTIAGCFVNLNHQGMGDLTYFTEGVETGLSILQVDKTASVAAVLGKANFATIHLKNPPKKVVICVDNDGRQTYQLRKLDETNAVIEGAKRLIAQGIKVAIHIPEKVGYDLNDVLLKEGKVALERSLSNTISLDEFKVRCESVNNEKEQPMNNKDLSINRLVSHEESLANHTKNELDGHHFPRLNSLKERAFGTIKMEKPVLEHINPLPLNRERERER